MWRELRTTNVFTMEASFCGPKTTHDGELNYHFTTNDLMEIGQGLCKSLLIYSEGQAGSYQALLD